MRSSEVLSRAAAQSAGVLEALAEVKVALVQVLGQECAVVYRTDASEIARRRAEGFTGVTRLDLLDLFLGLPLGMPVLAASLTRREKNLLRQAPDGCVEVQSGLVTRHLTVPLTVEMAVVAADDWNTALDRASEFAPFCNRAILLSQLPGDVDHLLIEAAYYGIGVAVVYGADVELLAAPERFIKRHYKAAGWWFAEEVYRQVSGKSQSQAV